MKFGDKYGVGAKEDTKMMEKERDGYTIDTMRKQEIENGHLRSRKQDTR